MKRPLCFLTLGCIAAAHGGPATPIYTLLTVSGCSQGVQFPTLRAQIGCMEVGIPNANPLKEKVLGLSRELAGRIDTHAISEKEAQQFLLTALKARADQDDVEQQTRRQQEQAQGQMAQQRASAVWNCTVAMLTSNNTGAISLCNSDPSIAGRILEAQAARPAQAMQQMQPMPALAAQAQYLNQQVTGMNKLCTYRDQMKGFNAIATITIPATQICPLSIPSP